MNLHFADSLVPRILTWLWPAQFPFGKLAIVDGDPGLGDPIVAFLDPAVQVTSDSNVRHAANISP